MKIILHVANQGNANRNPFDLNLSRERTAEQIRDMIVAQVNDEVIFLSIDGRVMIDKRS